MAALLFTCPITQMKVQHWLDDDEDSSDDDYEGITCQACAGVHFVNRKGKVLGGLVTPRYLGHKNIQHRCATRRRRPTPCPSD